MAKQGKLHANAIPRGDIQTRTVATVQAYSEFRLLNTYLYESDIHYDCYKLNVDNYICVYNYMYIIGIFISNSHLEF